MPSGLPASLSLSRSMDSPAASSLDGALRDTARLGAIAILFAEIWTALNDALGRLKCRARARTVLRVPGVCRQSALLCARHIVLPRPNTVPALVQLSAPGAEEMAEYEESMKYPVPMLLRHAGKLSVRGKIVK